VIERMKLSNGEVVAFLGRYPIDKVAMGSSTSIVPVYKALRDKGQSILVSHPKKTELIAESRTKTDRVACICDRIALSLLSVPAPWVGH